MPINPWVARFAYGFDRIRDAQRDRNAAMPDGSELDPYRGHIASIARENEETFADYLLAEDSEQAMALEKQQADRMRQLSVLSDKYPEYMLTLPSPTGRSIVQLELGKEATHRDETSNFLQAFQEASQTPQFQEMLAEEEYRRIGSLVEAGIVTATGKYTPEGHLLTYLKNADPEIKTAMLKRLGIEGMAVDAFMNLPPEQQVESIIRGRAARGAMFNKLLDKAMRFNFAATRFVDSVIENRKENFMLRAGRAFSESLQEIVDPVSRLYFSDVIERIDPKFADDHPYMTGFIGLAGDVLLSADTYVTFGSSGAARKAAFHLNKAMRVGGGYRYVRNVTGTMTDYFSGGVRIAGDVKVYGEGAVGPAKRTATGEKIDLIDSLRRSFRGEEAEKLASTAPAKRTSLEHMRQSENQAKAQPIAGTELPGGNLVDDIRETRKVEQVPSTAAKPKQEFVQKKSKPVKSRTKHGPAAEHAGVTDAERAIDEKLGANVQGAKLPLTPAGVKREGREFKKALPSTRVMLDGEPFYVTQAGHDWLTRRANTLIEESTQHAHIKKGNGKPVLVEEKKLSSEEAFKIAKDELEAALNNGEHPLSYFMSLGVLEESPTLARKTAHMRFQEALRNPTNFARYVDDQVLGLRFPGGVNVKVLGKRDIVKAKEVMSNILSKGGSTLRIEDGQFFGKLADLAQGIDAGRVLEKMPTFKEGIQKAIRAFEAAKPGSVSYADYFTYKFLENSGALSMAKAVRLQGSFRAAMSKWGVIPDEIRDGINRAEGAAARLVHDGEELSRRLFAGMQVEDMEKLGRVQTEITKIDSMNPMVHFGDDTKRWSELTGDEQLEYIKKNFLTEHLGPEVVGDYANPLWGAWAMADNWYSRVREVEMMHGLVVDELRFYSPLYYKAEREWLPQRIFDHFRRKASFKNAPYKQEMARDIEAMAEMASAGATPITNASTMLMRRTLDAAEAIKRTGVDLNDISLALSYASPEYLQSVVRRSVVGGKLKTRKTVGPLPTESVPSVAGPFYEGKFPTQVTLRKKGPGTNRNLVLDVEASDLARSPDAVEPDVLIFREASTGKTWRWKEATVHQWLKNGTLRPHPKGSTPMTKAGDAVQQPLIDSITGERKLQSSLEITNFSPERINWKRFANIVRSDMQNVQTRERVMGGAMPEIFKLDQFLANGLYGADPTAIQFTRFFDKVTGIFRFFATKARPAFAIKQIAGNASQAAVRGQTEVLSDGLKRITRMFRNGDTTWEIAPSLTDIGNAVRVFKTSYSPGGVLVGQGRRLNYHGLSDEVQELMNEAGKQSDEILKMNKKVAMQVNGERITWGQLWRELHEQNVVKGRDLSTGFTSINVSREAEAFSRKLQRKWWEGLRKHRTVVRDAVTDTGRVSETAMKNMSFLARHVLNYTMTPSTIEDYFRTLGFIHARKHGMSPAGAARVVDETFFDYAAGLSEFEERFMRRIAPFYSYDRFATELLLRTAVSNPGKIRNVQRTGETITKAFAEFMKELKGQEKAEDISQHERWITPEFLMAQPTEAAGWWKKYATTFKVFQSFNVVDTWRGGDTSGPLDDSPFYTAPLDAVWQRLTPLVKMPVDALVNRKTLGLSNSYGTIGGPASNSTRMETLGNPLSSPPGGAATKTLARLNPDADNFDKDQFVGLIIGQIAVAATGISGQASYSTVSAFVGTEAYKAAMRFGDLLTTWGALDENQLRSAVESFLGFEEFIDPNTGQRAVYMYPAAWYLLTTMMPSLASFSNLAIDEGGSKHPVDAVTDFILGTSTVNVDLSQREYNLVGPGVGEDNLYRMRDAYWNAANNNLMSDAVKYMQESKRKAIEMNNWIAFEHALRADMPQEVLRGEFFRGMLNEDRDNYSLPPEEREDQLDNVGAWFDSLGKDN